MRNFLPDYILKKVADGSGFSSECAKNTLLHDQNIRNLRSSNAAKFTFVPPQVSKSGEREIYSCAHTTNLPGKLFRSEGQAAVTDPDINNAYDYLGDTYKFYLDVFKRNSLDNHGMALIASVHYSKNYDNAFWNGEQMVFGDGDGKIFLSFTRSLSVIGHELTHGVQQYGTNFVYQDQSGALNESLADVFGVMVEQYHDNQTATGASWLIGADILAPGIKGVAIRSMKAPGTAYNDPLLGKDPQPATMAGYVETDEDNGGVHINSGIPNHAFYLAATKLGGYSWDVAGKIWYETMMGRSLSSRTNFSQFAVATLNTAQKYGNKAVQAVKYAWDEVEVPTDTTGAD